MATELYNTRFFNDPNLVSYWRMEGNSNDSKGGTSASNANVSFSSSYGVFGQGASFNGTNSTTTITGAIDPDSYNSGLSYSGWFYFNNTNDCYAFLHQESGSWGSIIIGVAGGAGKLYYRFGTGVNPNHHFTTTTAPTGQWCHIAIVHAGTSDKMYLNGVLIDNSSGGTLTNNGTTINFGSNAGLNNFFNGYIDDVSIFSRALTADEVQEIYRDTFHGNFEVSSSTKGYWKLDGNSNDSSGNGNNGTDTNVSYVAGKFGQAASFAGNGKVAITSSSLPSTGSFTISQWINYTAGTIASFPLLFNKYYSGSGNKSYATFINSDGKMGFVISSNGTADATTLLSSTALTAGVWNNIVTTYSSGGQVMSMFINGVSAATPVSGAGAIYAGNTSYGIGGNSAGTQYYTGLIDEVIVEDKVWTAYEIRKYYLNKVRNYGEFNPNSYGGSYSSTKLYLPLNGNSNDYSGNGNNGTDTAITYSLANGKFGMGAGFGGTSKILLPNIGISGAAVRTISMWFNTSVSTAQTLYSQGTSGATAQFFAIHTSINGTRDIYISSVSNDFYTATSIFNTGTWYNLVFTYNGGAFKDNSKVYLNGAEIPTSGTAASTLNTTNSNYGIGFDVPYNTRAYTGSICQVIVENKAWSANEVRKYYKNSKGLFRPSIT